MAIKTGMVFALETCCPAKDGFSAARIEEEVVVTDTGCKVITRFPGREPPDRERALIAGRGTAASGAVAGVTSPTATLARGRRDLPPTRAPDFQSHRRPMLGGTAAISIRHVPPQTLLRAESQHTSG
jgi:hypothetical protein